MCPIERVVCLDDAPDKRMAHHIGAIEMDEGDIFDPREDLLDLGKAAAPAIRSRCVVSPVMMNFELNPRRVRNIFICSGVVFWLRLRSRMHR